MSAPSSKISVSRCIALWLVFVLSIWLTAICLGRAEVYFTPFFAPVSPRLLLLPLNLTTNSLTIIGFSAICVWGLIFLIPQYYVCKSWLLQNASPKILPAVFLLHAMLVSIFFALSAEVSWAKGLMGVAAGVLLMGATILLNGPQQVRRNVSFRYRLLRRWLRSMKGQEERRE
jgi:hypothetical protein